MEPTISLREQPRFSPYPKRGGLGLYQVPFFLAEEEGSLVFGPRSGRLRLSVEFNGAAVEDTFHLSGSFAKESGRLFAEAVATAAGSSPAADPNAVSRLQLSYYSWFKDCMWPRLMEDRGTVFSLN